MRRDGLTAGTSSSSAAATTAASVSGG